MPRDELYLVTKLCNADQGYDTTTAAFDAGLNRLGIDYLDLLGNIVIPKSVNPARIASNVDVFDCELSENDMASISSLDDGNRLGPDPRTFDFTGR